jgi:thymus-specific serine protease
MRKKMIRLSLLLLCCCCISLTLANYDVPRDSPIRDLLLEGKAQWHRDSQKSSSDWQLFKQRLDHFDPTSTATFEQRYAVNASGWSGSKSSVKFLFLDGEAAAEFFQFQEVAAKLWARHFGAKYIQLEHRYYGKSYTHEMFSDENMRFLSVDQALADAANFMVTYSNESGEHGPWIVIGCSYSSALAVYMRIRYPSVVLASVAPSGPLLAVNNMTSFMAHFSVAASPQCSDAVRGASAYMYALTQSASGLAQLSREFKTCTPLGDDNSWFFLNELMTNVGSSDQFQNPPAWPLNATCDALMSNGSAPADVAAQWAELQLGTGPCMFVDERAYRAGLSVPAPSSSRSWLWEKCVSPGFGWFKSSYEGTSVFFPNQDVEHLISYCRSAFGEHFDAPEPASVNAIWGGLEPQATNVLVTNGLRDPWSTVSLVADVPPPSKVRAITYDAGHCAPLTEATDQDPPSLVQARQQIVDFIQDVINEYQSDH